MLLCSKHNFTPSAGASSFCKEASSSGGERQPTSQSAGTSAATALALPQPWPQASAPAKLATATQQQTGCLSQPHLLCARLARWHGLQQRLQARQVVAQRLPLQTNEVKGKRGAQLGPGMAVRHDTQACSHQVQHCYPIAFALRSKKSFLQSCVPFFILGQARIKPNDPQLLTSGGMPGESGARYLPSK